MVRNSIEGRWRKGFGEVVVEVHIASFPRFHKRKVRRDHRHLLASPAVMLACIVAASMLQRPRHPVLDDESRWWSTEEAKDLTAGARTLRAPKCS
jgi:hypothetical protein